jgi:two-component system, cell cycle sensor histidine kinase and response regulator CckA
LTRQLLAFARKQTLEMRPLNLNNVIAGFMKMIRRTLRENVKIDTHLDQDIYTIEGDIGQIEQVIMNLAVNAHDAMPAGGTLSIETANVLIDEDYALTRQGVVPGPYVKMTVSDTGLGMTRETLEKIFEPFFTTKERGRGTGLGLSTVYGIVKQHGGIVWADSVPEKGATFQVFFPARPSLESGAAVPIAQEEPAQGTETILLAEDQEQVRKMACTILKRYGYQVIDAPDGQTALSLMASVQRPIHLLITDVIMPGMNGKELYERLAAAHPDLKVLYMSGYTADIIGHHGRLGAGEQFIQKPFSVKEFARKIRGILGDRDGHTAGG